MNAIFAKQCHFRLYFNLLTLIGCGLIMHYNWLNFLEEYISFYSFVQYIHWEKYLYKPQYFVTFPSSSKTQFSYLYLLELFVIPDWMSLDYKTLFHNKNVFTFCKHLLYNIDFLLTRKVFFIRYNWSFI